MSDQLPLISLFNNGYHQDVLVNLKNNKKITLSGVGNFSSKVFIISDLLKKHPDLGSVIWVVNDKTEQENTVKSLEWWTNRKIITLDLPDKNSIDKQDERRADIYLMETISSIIKQEKVIIVTPYENLLRPLPKKQELEKQIITIKATGQKKITNIFEELIDRGYTIAEDQFLEKGQYRRQGGILEIFPVNEDYPIKIEADFDSLGQMVSYDQKTKEIIGKIKNCAIYPLNTNKEKQSILDFLDENNLLIDDEVEVIDDVYEDWVEMIDRKSSPEKRVTFTPFLEEGQGHQNFHFFSVLKYHTIIDLLNDLKEKKQTNWRVLVFTKHATELKNILNDKNISFSIAKNEPVGAGEVLVYEVDKDSILPYSWQNPAHKIIIISDREIVSFKEENIKKKSASYKFYVDFLTSLKLNDYVVHQDHGIALFQGLVKKTVDEVTREYLKLAYAENDKLFVPIDQADKVNKYIGDLEHPPRLTRLGSSEWSTLTNKVKKETQKIAKELLELYASREAAKGFQFKADTLVQEKFEKTFPYEETPGQIRAIMDVKKDMETKKPMDRLVCGDVGFGKTEVAMRAAFKSIENKKQVAFVSPITILADQHYRTFRQRMEEFHVRVEMLSRFKSKKEQEEIIERLKKGEVDIVIGTHRLLQPDVKFNDLGLVIIDEEQRFGVNQKEEFKKLRNEVDILTMTATPIPRTLNISLNKLRDISVITTPPPGRLPIITEVRRYSPELIRDVILKEVARKGQVYFLHNRVQTIDGMADKLRSLVPEAKFIVSHGKLSPTELEDRIISFKEGKYDVLVSSTIIENGIDLPNANTLIVNNAERFGLAQLYQLRGRVGRSKKQAYAYLLYHSQRLKYEAKKRLRAIVEASELGSGFQIAMKDLEIRGAGDILGANQHGAINVVGVSHFVRMLAKAVDDLKAGKVEKETEQPVEVSIELPLTCFIPDDYIINTKEKINVYQRLASAGTHEYLEELKDELIEDYGKMPVEVGNLFKILDLKLLAKKAGLVNVKAENIHDADDREIILHMSGLVKPENIINLLEYNSKWIISGSKLKIKTKYLGVNWLEELKESIIRLSQKITIK